VDLVAKRALPVRNPDALFVAPRGECEQFCSALADS
jgi:hypothetical protein